MSSQENKGRGGVRPGAGRKRKDDDKKAVTVSFSCSPEERARLASDVERSGLSQGKYIRSKIFAENKRKF